MAKKKKGRSAHSVQTALKTAQRSLLNMRMLYEQSVQEKLSFQRQIQELKTVLGAVLITLDGKTTVSKTDLQNAQGLHGIDFQPNEDEGFDLLAVAVEEADAELNKAEVFAAAKEQAALVENREEADNGE